MNISCDEFEPAREGDSPFEYYEVTIAPKCSF